MEHGFDDEGAFDGGVGVEVRSPSGASNFLMTPGVDCLLVHPEGDAPTPDESPVICLPVADPVSEYEV